MTRCRACGGDAARHSTADTVVLASCARCGLIQLDDDTAPVDETFYDYYASRIGLPRDEVHLPLTTERYRSLLAKLEPLVSGRRLLDVGCGEGQLVAAASASGWDAHGIDLSPSAVEICRSFDLPCSRTDLFDASLAAGSFDVITMIELIEHVADPGRFLARAEELLTPGGVVHLTTPNHGALGRRVLGQAWGPYSPAHLSYFSPASFRRLVASSTGLEVVGIGSRNISAAALRKLARRRAPAVAGGPGAHVGTEFAAEQELRHRLERSTLRRAAKSLANAALSATGTGETLVVLLRRPGGASR